jgi:glycosyltransferase involved in cell wall biosynthesis
MRHKGFWVGLCGELWERLALRLPWARIIAVSEYTKERLTVRGARQPITVIPNGIAPMPPAILRTRKSAVPLVSCVSRLVPGKRVDVLIRALAIARKEVPGLRAVIVGQGGEQARLERLAEALGIADAVAFTGRVADITDVYRMIASSRAFCLPSEVEGFGIAVLEAMACGVPVACSDIPPLREVTRGGKGGVLFPVGDAGALAAALVRLLNDKAFAARKQREARQLAASYGWDGITGQVERVYESLARLAEA